MKRIALAAVAALALCQPIAAKPVAPIASRDEALEYAAYASGRCFIWLGEQGRLETVEKLKAEPALLEMYYRGIEAEREAKIMLTYTQCKRVLAGVKEDLKRWAS